jgi:hypothetical protein
MSKLLQVGLLAIIALGIADSSVRAVDSEAISKAIDQGVTALRGMQGADGTWPYPDIGATALAGLTLLECGAKPDDKAVVLAADAVRKASLTLTHNYSISLAILFFDRLGDPSDIPLIESLTVRLLAGQTPTGGWNYRSPPVSDAEARRLQAQLMQRKELAGRRELPRPGEVRRRADELPKEIQMQLAALNRMPPMPVGLGSDNSNTQFATLALWVARRYGLPVENALKRVETRFRSRQQTGGGWGYFEPGMRAGGMAGSTASMTCAGLLGLAVADGQTRETAKDVKRGSKTARDLNKDPNIRRGLLALSSVVGQPQGERRQPGERLALGRVGGRTYYFLWSVERVAVALDLKTIGKKDWYAWGAEILLANQQEDGSWRGHYAECGADTCFALLFLKRANLAPDLTHQLAGQVQDPGERMLKGGGAGSDLVGGAGKIADVKPGIEGKDTRRPIEGKYPTSTAESKTPNATPKPVSDTTPKPVPEPAPRSTVADTVAGRLATDLIKSSGARQIQLLKQMQEGKGVEFTEALAAAIPQLPSQPQQKARAALVERLTRMKDTTLTAYLADEDAEIRRAAASASALKASKVLVPHVIPLLRDPNPLVAQAAHSALKEITGSDFGPAADAGPDERAEAARRWLQWWDKQKRP